MKNFCCAFDLFSRQNGAEKCDGIGVEWSVACLLPIWDYSTQQRRLFLYCISLILYILRLLLRFGFCFSHTHTHTRTQMRIQMGSSHTHTHTHEHGEVKMLGGGGGGGGDLSGAQLCTLTSQQTNFLLFSYFVPVPISRFFFFYRRLLFVCYFRCTRAQNTYYCCSSCCCCCHTSSSCSLIIFIVALLSAAFFFCASSLLADFAKTFVARLSPICPQLRVAFFTFYCTFVLLFLHFFSYFQCSAVWPAGGSE